MSRSGHSKRVCKWKIKHATEEDALAHATSLCNDRGVPVGTWRAYDCDHCEFYHVGRPMRPPHIAGEPRDITLYNALGPRAYFCGVYENHKNMATRRRYFERLLMRQLWKSWAAKRVKRSAPLP